jgi:hypothetical protein
MLGVGWEKKERVEGRTGVGVVVLVLFWANLLGLEGLVLDFYEFNHCAGFGCDGM